MDKNYALSMSNFNEFNAYVNTALNNNEINKDEWYEIVTFHTKKWYLAQDNPRAQSGHGGDEYHYAFSHLPIIECIYKNGTFLDVGCANGHLMEMVYKWGAAVGFDLRMFGVDISEGLIELAKNRLPQWHDNFFIANKYFWKPEIKFDYIHVMVIGGYPEYDERTCFEYYMENYLADGGRMIIGPYWYENEDTQCKELFDSGISPTGYIVKTHYNRPNWFRKAIWFDKK